jgi:hypothetical protein
MESKMSEYITDPELLAQLGGNVAEEKPKTRSKEGYIEDPALLAELNKTLSTAPANTEGPVEPSEGAVLGAVAPAVTAYGMGPTGVGQLGPAVKAGANPYLQTIGEGLRKTADIYKARPIMAPLIDAAGLAVMGVPPIAGGQQVMGAWDKLTAAKQGAQGVSQELSQGAAATTPVKGLPTTETIKPFGEMRTAAGANSELGMKLKNIYESGGGNNAVKSFLGSAEGRAAQAADPLFAARAAQYLQAVPGYGTQAMKVVSPFLKGAARVAGPVGMAANLYEAAPYLAAAGPELTSGAAQNRMAEAQRMMLSRPTPAPLTPQEASNLLSSGDERTINIYGGRRRLDELVKSGLRQTAASKVMGPVAPQ